ADRFGSLIARRTGDVKRLAGNRRAPLEQRGELSWPRLTEPRGLVTSLVEQHGWRIENATRIPHDLWPAGSLPELTLAEQLTVLLIGFDLMFEIDARERVVEIVPIEGPLTDAKPQAEVPPSVARPRPAQSPRETKQVYTLRVREQPVRAVLRELTQRLKWPIEVDEASIRAAGLSLDERVSFAVEDVEQEELLDALLRPAGLDFRREGELLRIVPREDASD
ncbi:MAG: hypothetical protein L0228_18695, partial [Planctomycetes bacterium]|nr:hypothetical protein [Planctomycetota bacterium]